MKESMIVENKIREIIKKYFLYPAKKVSSDLDEIVIDRKERIGVRKRILMIPLYEYKSWKETLNEWDSIVVTVDGFDVHICVCVDEIGKSVYWKYDIV